MRPCRQNFCARRPGTLSCAFGDWFTIVSQRDDSPLCADRSVNIASVRKSSLTSTEYVAQLVLGALKNALSIFREIFAGAVDIEVQHRHCRLIWLAFTPLALLGKAFKRERDFSRICCSKNIWLEIEHVAVVSYPSGPAAFRSRRRFLLIDITMAFNSTSSFQRPIKERQRGIIAWELIPGIPP